MKQGCGVVGEAVNYGKTLLQNTARHDAVPPRVEHIWKMADRYKTHLLQRRQQLKSEGNLQG